MSAAAKTICSHPPGHLSNRCVIAFLAGLLLSACGQPSESTSAPTYTEGLASSAGTGRYYMEREIAGVMSYRGADWLERTEREQLERTDLVLENLELGPASVVADIGAGSGYFSRRIAQLVPDGEVIAVDIQPEMLAIIEAKSVEANIGNIRTVLAQEKSPNLAKSSIDLALLVDVYHELKWPREVMLNIRDALKPGGKVILVEYRAEDESVPIIPIHKMSETQARQELEAVGLELAANQDFLPSQHFLIFTAATEKPGRTELSTLAWDCTNTGYVVTNQADDSNSLWIFLPHETLQLDAAPAGQDVLFSDGRVTFRYEGRLAELRVENTLDICTENRRASIQEDAKLRGMDFWATGNEPPWRLEIGPEVIRLITGYESTVTEFPPVAPAVDVAGRMATYSTRGEDSLLEIEISGSDCGDSMSGERFESKVTIRLIKEGVAENSPATFTGCGKALH